jgi:hypothetical protein
MMRRIRHLSFLGTIVVLPLCSALQAAEPDARSSSPDGVWRELPAPAPAADSDLWPVATYRVFEIDTGALSDILVQAPLEHTAAAGTAEILLTLPTRDGSYARFEILESPVLAGEVARSNPDIRSFVGRGVDDPASTARLVQTPAGFYAFIRTVEGMTFMEPYGLGNRRQSMLYGRRDLVEPLTLECPVGEEAADLQRITADPNREAGSVQKVAPSGATLSTYDLAVTATGEYTTFFDPGGGTTNTMSQIAASVAAVNAIYVPEVAVRFTVACTNVFTDPDTDPFTDADSSGPSLDQNQASTDANCGGSAGYDIGHVFHRRSGGGFSGLAGGNVCNDANKARGYSSVNNPVPGTMIWVVDQLSHEMGHQFTAAHIFNSDVTGCAGNRVANSAYEPGSGSTIMSYAAGTRCDFDFPGSNDAYFHGHNFDQITNHRDGAGNCGTNTASGNTPPTVDAGADFTIPQDTPFSLTASGNDPDNDALTYCWEQFDLGPPGDLPTNVNGPLFRSRPPSSSATRTFPILSDILAGNPTPTELLPQVDRTLNFRSTVRDNQATAGGVNNDAMVITVAGDPFFVISPNGGESFGSGCTEPVTWEVGGGSVTATVDIQLSSDGGSSFSDLDPGTGNDGATDVELPCATTTQGRVRAQAVGNIFFDVSDNDFTIEDIAPTLMGVPADTVVECDAVPPPANPAATDDCDPAPSIDFEETRIDGDCANNYTLEREWTATDSCGTSSSETQIVTVQDTTPPDVTCGVGVSTLWPPNHKFVDVGLTFDASDNCDTEPLTFEVEVSSDEAPANAPGSGGPAHCPDGVVGPDHSVALRAERSGAGDGRVYTIRVSASDDCGNTGHCEVQVTVPVSRRPNATAVDSGQTFDPTTCS